MKIFLSFLQGRPDHPIPSYQFWEYYIKNGIEEAGESWIEAEIDWAEGLVSQYGAHFDTWKTNAWEKTVANLKKEKPDLFLSYLYPHQVDPSAIRAIHDLGIPTVNFFCDNIREFTRVPSVYKSFDLHWVPEYKALRMYSQAGCRYLHLPMPMWVKPIYRVSSGIEKPVVSFIGSKDIQRHLLFEEVVKRKPAFALEIYGAAWQDTSQPTSLVNSSSTLLAKVQHQISYLEKNGMLSYYRKLRQRNYRVPVSDELRSCLKGRPSFEEYLALSSASLVTLGVNRYPSYRFPLDEPDSYSRLRDIEAPMLGACYLTEWTEGLDQYYTLGTDIETYSSAFELVQKTEALLKDEMKRRQLRVNGQKRALENLSIPQSIQSIKNYFSLS